MIKVRHHYMLIFTIIWTGLMVSLVNGVKKRNQMSAEHVFHGKMDILSMVVKIDFLTPNFVFQKQHCFLSELYKKVSTVTLQSISTTRGTKFQNINCSPLNYP